MAESFVDVEGVGFVYPKSARPVLTNVSFQLGVGQWAVLFGRGASGKSTMMKLLAGALSPTKGHVVVNSKPASKQAQLLADGFVSLEHSRKHSDRSTTERIHEDLMRAATSDAPLVLLDDVADHLGVEAVQSSLLRSFEGRTVLITTRHVAIAQALELPLLFLHNTTIACQGTCDAIAQEVGCPKTIDVWMEGVRYDVLRRLRAHPGVIDVRLMSTDQFAGKKLRITLLSGRYLPSVYDLISRSETIRIEEIPSTVADILTHLTPSGTVE